MSDLRLEDLTIEYSSGGYIVRPVEGMNLSIPSGELVLLLGPSGGGKTTLLSVLAGILRPASGTVRFAGIRVEELAGQELTDYRRNTVGIVFQAFNLIPSLSALENVAAPLLAAGVGTRDAQRRAGELLERVGLGDRLAHRPGSLSGGQQQRVAIARALVNDPPLLLADEPTAHLDYVQVETVLRLLREVAIPGRIVVVATHDERLLPLADRVVELGGRAPARARPPEHLVLEEGDVVFREGEPGELIYMVWEGAVELTRRTAGGADQVVARIGPGRYFGELSPLFGLPRSATARAASHTVVTGYPPGDFRKQMGSPTLVDLITGADVHPPPLEADGDPNGATTSRS